VNLIEAVKSKALQVRNIAFYVALPSFFLGLVLLFGTRTIRCGAFFVPLALAGLAVVLATFWLKESLLHKVFFILAGGSGAALAITLIVADTMTMLGCPPGGDGGGIVLPMILICPPLFITGALGGIVFLIKESGAGDSSAQ
jgi:hypothetical protein